MHILLLEPFYTGSHATWAKAYQKHSRHQVRILSLKGKHWKWRMHGGAVTLAHQFLASNGQPDLILATDMLDVTTFLALTRKRTTGIPVATYFHENQLTYPWSPTDQDVSLKRDNHYSFINYTTALASDYVLFNSNYHLNSFLTALPNWLKAFPDYKELDSVSTIRAKSRVLHLGMDLQDYLPFCPTNVMEIRQKQKPLILWNHRWEYDKNPDDFFSALMVLAQKGLDFEVVVLGEQYRQQPAIFKEAQQKLSRHIRHWGYVQTTAEYARWLWLADILPVTSYQDFFGGSIVEAMFCNTYPLLPQRLAYREHVPVAHQSKHFYGHVEALIPLLERTIQEIAGTRQVVTQDFVDQYDWGKMGTVYDDFFELVYQHQITI